MPEAEEQAEKALTAFFRLLTQLMRDTFGEIRKTRITIDIGDKS